MALNVFFGLAPTRGQIATVTPATVQVGDVFTLTWTRDDGQTASVSYTATLTTAADVSAGLVAAINASSSSIVYRTIATDATGSVTLAARTAGEPFSVAGTTTDGGGANTQTLTVAVTQTSSSPFDYGCAGNWSLGHVPTAGEDVAIAAGTGSISYGLNQSGTAIASFRVMGGDARTIGRDDSKYLRLACTGFQYDGISTSAWFDLGSSSLTPVITNSGTPATGRRAVCLKGTAMTGLIVEGGSVGVGVLGDAYTISGVVRVSGGTLALGATGTITHATSFPAGQTLSAA